LSSAQNDVEFLMIVRKEAEEIGLVIDQVEWIETLSDRLERFDLEEYIIVLAKEVDKEGGCRFGVFHAWED
jgi:hypothetical protein